MDFTSSDIFAADWVTISGILILPMITLCVLTFGIYFHVKIIKISIKEKEMTWKLDITNSCILTAHYFHTVFMNLFTYMVQDLHNYTGNWFCYVSKGLSYYGGFYMSGHTLIVVIMKYILVVHWQKVLEIGQNKIKEIFFWLNFLHPIFMLLIHVMVRPDFFVVWDGYQHIDRCLGDPKHNLEPGTNKSFTKLHNLCDIIQPPTENYFEFTISVFRITICWIQTVVFYIVFGNFLEVLFYCLIFKFTHK